MGQGGEPSEIDDRLPMIGRNPTTKLDIATYEKSKAGHQLLVTEHENSIAESWFPDPGRPRTRFTPERVDDASVYTVQEFIRDVAN